MGSALARTLIRAGHAVTVWNRSPAKTQPMVDLGASCPETIAAAVKASSVLLLCVENYQTARNLLSPAEIIESLKGRTVIQLSTGTPHEARDADAWFTMQGAEYLDGGILGGPAAIGTPRVQILYSGSRAVFDRCQMMLCVLGENSRFVGADPGTAAVLDLAWLVNRYGIYLSAAHGAMLCEAEDVSLEAFAEVFAPNDAARWLIDVIKSKDFENPSATLSIWNAALQLILKHAREHGIDSAFPEFVSGVLNRAEAAGYGNEHIAAMVKVLRGDKAAYGKESRLTIIWVEGFRGGSLGSIQLIFCGF